MLIVKVDNGSQLEKSLKILKNKVLKTKQNDILKKRKEYIKKSVHRRNEIKNAIHKGKLTNFR